MRSECAICHTFLPFLVLCFRGRVRTYEFLLVKFHRHWFVGEKSFIAEKGSKLWLAVFILSFNFSLDLNSCLCDFRFSCTVFFFFFFLFSPLL